MIILDTNVVSEFVRTSPADAVVDWLDSQALETLYLSSVTVAEILAGLEIMPEGKRASALRLQLETRFLPLFIGRVLPFDNSCTRAYAEIYRLSRKKGNAISLADAVVASIAVTHGMAVATRDMTPFLSTGVAVINPWDFGAG